MDCSVYFHLIFISHFYRISSGQFNFWKISNNGSRSYLPNFELGCYWYKFGLKARMSEPRWGKSNRKSCHFWSPDHCSLHSDLSTIYVPGEHSQGSKIHSYNSKWTNRLHYHLFSLWHNHQHLFHWRPRKLSVEEQLSTKTASAQLLFVLLSFSCSKLIECSAATSDLQRSANHIIQYFNSSKTSYSFADPFFRPIKLLINCAWSYFRIHNRHIRNEDKQSVPELDGVWLLGLLGRQHPSKWACVIIQCVSQSPYITGNGILVNCHQCFQRWLSFIAGSHTQVKI